MQAPVRTLLFSTLYPSSARPVHGAFVETRLRRLLASGQVETCVVAPVPWFPSTHPRHGDYALMAATPRVESRHGVPVLHPRYLLPPRVGQHIAPLMLALGALPALRQLVRDGFDFDLIDAHYYYPDGVAAALLGAWLGKPFTVTARGSDLNVLGANPLSRRMMRWAAGRAETSIGVCQALVDILRDWGVDPQRLQVMRNGVDLERFSPVAPQQARADLGLSADFVMLSVGQLVDVKGHDLTIAAFRHVLVAHPESRLYLVGQGRLLHHLQALAQSCGVGSRVVFVGPVPNEQLAKWYSAADVMVLSSRSEGWANVLLESLACGTPVVATRVGGSAEVLTDPSVGLLIDQREPALMANAIRQFLDNPPDRVAVRRYAERFSWDATTQAQLDLFQRIVQTRAAGAGKPDI